MNREQLNEGINGIHDELIEEKLTFKSHHKSPHLLIVLAMASLVFFLFPGKPNPQQMPRGTEILALQCHNGGTQGHGDTWYLDAESTIASHPWRDDQEIKELPVFVNEYYRLVPSGPVGPDLYLGEDAYEELMKEAAALFHDTLLDVSDMGMNATGKNYSYAMLGERILMKNNKAGKETSSYNDEQQAKDALAANKNMIPYSNYTITYSAMMTESGTAYTPVAYPASGNPAENIINHSFHAISYHMDENNVFSSCTFSNLTLNAKACLYPIITLAEAREMVRSSKSIPVCTNDKADLSLVTMEYMASYTIPYYFPVYVFYVPTETPNIYEIYTVIAVDPAYVEYTYDEPLPQSSKKSPSHDESVQVALSVFEEMRTPYYPSITREDLVESYELDENDNHFVVLIFQDKGEYYHAKVLFSDELIYLASEGEGLPQ